MLAQLLRRFQAFDGLSQMSNASLDDLAQMTTDNFRSFGTNREDSLVFIMGLINLGTILCYSIYNQLFGKSGNTKTWPLNEEYLTKKIQSILDELVLHVHTTSYYRTAHQEESEARGFHSNRPMQVSQRRSLYTGHGFLNIPEPIFEQRSYHPTAGAGHYQANHREDVRLDSDADFNFYLMKEVRKLMAEWFSMLGVMTPSPSRTKRQIFPTLSTYPPQVSNGTYGHRRFQNPNRLRLRRRRPFAVNGTGAGRRWYSASRKVGVPLTESLAENQSAAQSGADGHSRKVNGIPASTSHSVVASDGSTVTNRQLGRKKANIPLLSLGNRPRFIPVTTTTSTTSTTTQVPDVIAATMTKSSSHVAETVPESDIPANSGSHILPVESLFPHQKTDTVRSRAKNDDTGDDHDISYVHPNHQPETFKSRAKSAQDVPVRDRSPAPKQMRNQEVRPPYGQAQQTPYQAVHNDDGLQNEASWTNEESQDAESAGFIANLMQLVMQTAPLALDVLNVYKRQSAPSKCMESLLCQVNQDWKKKGSVPAAMAPFLSISLGWLQEDVDRPSLSQVLMAVRAGWIGKNCAALYPRCSHPIERPTWTVSQVPVSDSVHLPSIVSPTFKVKPPVEFSQPPRPTTKPVSTTTKPTAAPPTSTTMRALRAGPDKSGQSVETVNHKSTTVQEELVTPDPADQDEWDQEDETGPVSWIKPNGGDSQVVGTSLQVGNNQPVGHVSVDRISDKTQKPWGKPSRLSTPGELSLSDIVRGVYPPTTQDQHEDPEEREDTQQDDDEDEDDEDEYSNETEDEDGEEETATGDILHDLKANHFVDKRKPQQNSYPNTRHVPQLTVDDPKMRPRLQLGNPADQWLSPSVWANSQSATNVQLPWRPVDGNDANYLRSEEELYDDRGRDRVSTSFTHEDAVKDVRLHEVVMQYLRDRSA